MGLTVTGIGVAPACTALIVTVRVPVAPRLRLVVAGTSETSLGRLAVTVTVLVALVPLRLAVSTAVPGVLADTEMVVLVCPAAMVTEAGTETILDALLESETVVALLCAALMVTVSVPVPP